MEGVVRGIIKFCLILLDKKTSNVICRRGIPMLVRFLSFIIFFNLGSPLAHAIDQVSGHHFSFQSIEGDQLHLSSFKGKAVLVVNTASRCGFTKQYGELQQLWTKYRNLGLVVLGVPSNDFGGQEPGTEVAIKEFCRVNFDVNFPLTEKVTIKGSKAHPFFQWASTEVGIVGKPRWNFHKFLLGPNGRLVNWFSSPTSPISDKVITAIEALIIKR